MSSPSRLRCCVALTVTPALSLMLLPGRRERTRVTAGHGRSSRATARCCPGWSRRRGGRWRLSSFSLAVTAASYPLLGEEFLPNFKEYDFLMHWVEKPGTSLEAMTRITLRASEELRAIPGVRNFGAHIGRAEVADEVVGVNFTELWISLDPDGRLRKHRRQDPVGRRRLSRAAARPADLPARADQRSADRRERHDRRPHLRPRSRRCSGRRRPRSARRSAPSHGAVDVKVQARRSCRRSK